MLNMSHEGSHSNVKFVAKFWNDSTQNSWIHISEKHGTKLLKFVNTKLKPCCKKYIFDLLCKNFLFLLFLFNSVLFILYIYTTWVVLTLGIDNVRMVKISLNLGSQVKMFGPLIQKIVSDIVNWNENKVIIVLNIMNWNENRVQILWVQELEWKQGKKFQRKRTGEPWSENVVPDCTVPLRWILCQTVFFLGTKMHFVWE